MTYEVVVYDEGDFELRDVWVADRTEHADFVAAVADLIETATARYNPRDLGIRRGDNPDESETFPENAIGLYEPGQPGNVVLQEVDQ